MTPKQIKVLRIKLGLSQQAFSNRLGVGVATVSRWETGKTRPSPMAIKLLRLLCLQDKPSSYTQDNACMSCLPSGDA